jgi:hypothetical protein
VSNILRLLPLFLIACGSEPAAPDAALADAGELADAAAPDDLTVESCPATRPTRFGKCTAPGMYCPYDTEGCNCDPQEGWECNPIECYTSCPVDLLCHLGADRDCYCENNAIVCCSPATCFTGCAGYFTCLSNCGTSAPPSCAEGCRHRTTVKGQSLMDAFRGCLDQTCNAPDDGGVARCSGAPGDTCCEDCRANAQSGPGSLVGPCMPERAGGSLACTAGAADPACGVCAGALSACVGDKP